MFSRATPHPARLLFPALRWSEETGFDHLEGLIGEALGLRVGGFILFGGEAQEAKRLVDDLRSRASLPLLVGADLERGAGQQFSGCTSLPPAWALASVGDLEGLWRAGELTAREARALGVDWVYAPVADLGNEPTNPIIATRALGSETCTVARGVAAWTMGCLTGGALPCAKHFPGHGRTLSDSHREMPLVAASLAELADDLVPFAAAVAAGAPSIMTAHVAYPALDREGQPATRSASMLNGVLRGALGFRGAVVSDALVMEGALAGEGEIEAAALALSSGVDALLYPRDLQALAQGLARSLGDTLQPRRVKEAVARLDRLRKRLQLVPPRPRWRSRSTDLRAWGREEDLAWARETALSSVHLLGAELRELPWPLSLVTIDDDLGGPFPAPPRATFLGTLGALGVDVDPSGTIREGGSRLIALYADVRGWKGRAGLSVEARSRLVEALGHPGPSLVVLFSHAWNAAEVPPSVPVLCAWGGEPLMQEAAARAVARLATA